MPFKKSSRNAGFSLVELIVTVAVLGAIIVPIGTMFVSNTVRYYQENKKIAVSSDSLIACNKIFDLLRRATQSTITLSGDGKQVSFEVEGKTGSVYFDAAKKTLVLSQGGADQVLLKQVTAAAFSQPEPGRISFSLTLTVPLPFQQDYLYQRTYDYTKRS